MSSIIKITCVPLNGLADWIFHRLNISGCAKPIFVQRKSVILYYWAGHIVGSFSLIFLLLLLFRSFWFIHQTRFRAVQMIHEMLYVVFFNDWIENCLFRLFIHFTCILYHSINHFYTHKQNERKTHYKLFVLFWYQPHHVMIFRAKYSVVRDHNLFFFFFAFHL